MGASFFLAAIGAGAASAVMVVSVVGGTFLAAPLFLLAPMPVMIAALGWGTPAGILATAVGLAVIALATESLPSGLIFGLLIAGPGVFLAHLVGLARPLDPADPSAPREWYPLGRVLVAAALVAAAVTIVAAVVTGFDPAELTREYTKYFSAAMTEPGAAPSEAATQQVEAFARLIVTLAPFVVPATLTFSLVLSLYLAAKVTARSERLARPWESVSTVDPPRGFVLVFAVACAVALLIGSGPGLVAAPFVGAGVIVYLMVGLALVHEGTRGNSARFLILAVMYGLMFLFSLPALIIAALGLADALFRLRARRAARLNPGRPDRSRDP